MLEVARTVEEALDGGERDYSRVVFLSRLRQSREKLIQPGCWIRFLENFRSLIASLISTSGNL